MKRDLQSHLRLLIILGGIAQTLGAAAALNMGEKMSLKEIVLFSLFVGPLSGWLTIVIRSWFLTWVGRWFGGNGNFVENRLCLAWSWAPIVYFLPLWGVKMILFKNETFRLVKPVLEGIPLLKGLSGFLDFFDFVMYGWSLFALIRMLSEVNGFSSIRSIVSIILSGLLLAVPLLLLLYFAAPWIKL